MKTFYVEIVNCLKEVIITFFIEIKKQCKNSSLF